VQTGTAVIRGRVFAADTGKPLRRARIQIIPAGQLGGLALGPGPGLGPAGDNRTTSTNADGRYEIKDLPAGRYNVAVNRSGYLRLSYGQRRPFEQGKPLQLVEKQVVENVDFTLPRMSLITGRVYDEAGEAISGVRMFAMRSIYFEGRRRLVPVAGGPIAMTDDAGQYRLLGLPPGSYYVSADMRETWTVNEGGGEQVVGYAPTYFPGTTDLADARRVTVGVGAEASNTDFSLIPGRTATVSGTAVDSQGRPLVGRPVQLAQESRGPDMFLVTLAAGTPVAADGSFRIRDLAPGEYKLNVRTTTEIGGTTIQEAATVPITVIGVDIDNVTLITSVGWSATGRVTTDTGEAPGIPRERIRVIGRPLNGGLTPVGPSGQANPDSGRVRDDWTFAVTGLYGPASLRVTLPDDWAVKAILRDGGDVTDTEFDIKGGETLDNIQVVLTNRVNTVTGELTNDKGAPAADGTVIVFASSADKWAEDSRFVRSARPDQEGKFQIRGLPPGEYLAVAVDYVEERMWNDPEYLESIRRYGQTLTLGEAGSQSVALKLISP
jgi:protocatechuate 3,4-dioxygenase beta subunit